MFNEDPLLSSALQSKLIFGPPKRIDFDHGNSELHAVLGIDNSWKITSGT